MTLQKWNELKVWLAPVTALVLWSISVVCFVFGLSFKNPIMVVGHDFTLIISFAVALCNTFIQLVGNSNLDKDDSGVFAWIWFGSYVLGIASNTNSLLQMLGVSSVILEWAVALSLGAIIEIAPEKLIMIWVKSYKHRPAQNTPNKGNNTFVPSHGKTTPNYTPTFRPQTTSKVSGTDRRKMLEAERQRMREDTELPSWARGE